MPSKERNPETLHGRHTLAPSTHGGDMYQIMAPKEGEDTSLGVYRQQSEAIFFAGVHSLWFLWDWGVLARSQSNV
jgi:hypothetical protein